MLTIVGPTAVGKTRLAVFLARSLAGEVINADSRQVYRYMDIGTAKPTPEERQQAPHHLLDLLNPDESFDLGTFLSLARSSREDIEARGRLPILAGGTGQYVWALLEGWEVPRVPPDPEFRSRKAQDAARLGPEALHQELQRVDPQRAAQLDPRNVRRVIRALEVLRATGISPSRYPQRGTPPAPGTIIGLTMDREALYRRIDQRVDRMMEAGFLSEARDLTDRGYPLGRGALACPGYRELGQYLSGEIDLAEAVQRTKFQTHRLARRQFTWFKLSDPRIHWLDAASPTLDQEALALAAGAAG